MKAGKQKIKVEGYCVGSMDIGVASHVSEELYKILVELRILAGDIENGHPRDDCVKQLRNEITRLDKLMELVSKERRYSVMLVEREKNDG